MAVTEALTDGKHEQVGADGEGTGAGRGRMPGAGEEDAPSFVLSSAAHRQGLNTRTERTVKSSRKRAENEEIVDEAVLQRREKGKEREAKNPRKKPKLDPVWSHNFLVIK